MDVAFLLRARRMLDEREPVRPDFAVLNASITALSGPVSSRCTSRPWRQDPHRPALAEILSGGPAWRDAVAAQKGSFCPAMTRERAE